MNRDFHIFASRSDTHFVIKGVGEGYPRAFTSLVDATRHARTQSGGEAGMVVIYSEDGPVVNRIPLISAALSPV
jgi:hypothetical protein